MIEEIVCGCNVIKESSNGIRMEEVGNHLLDSNLKNYSRIGLEQQLTRSAAPSSALQGGV